MPHWYRSREGEVGREMYIIAKGEVAITKSGNQVRTLAHTAILWPIHTHYPHSFEEHSPTMQRCNDASLQGLTSTVTVLAGR